LSRKKKPKKRKHHRGNVAAESHYDPFPKSGRVKQYEPFIRKQVGQFCKQYPGLNRLQVLCRAVELALAAEKAFKPELGYDFSTYLRHRLKELHRLHDQDENATTSPVHYSKGELEQDRAEERGEEVELEFSGGNGPRLTFDLQWCLATVFQTFIDESEIRTYKRSVAGVVEEGTNYSRPHEIPVLGFSAGETPKPWARHRLAAGVQLGGSDNAPAIHERISTDLPELIKQQPVGETLKGWSKAVIDHLIRRQREADDEAEKRQVGDHSPTFLEAEQNPVDLRFPGARRPPKYLPLRLPLASMDAPISTDHSGDAGKEAASTLHETVGGGTAEPGVDQRVETVRWALKELRPSLRKVELSVANRWLDILDSHRSYSQAELAAETGHSNGQVSKLWNGLAGKVAEKIRARK
jgi:hypothetical protein